MTLRTSQPPLSPPVTNLSPRPEREKNGICRHTCVFRGVRYECRPKPYPTARLPSIMRDAVRAIARHVAAPEVLAGKCAIAAAAYLAQTRINAPRTA